MWKRLINDSASDWPFGLHWCKIWWAEPNWRQQRWCWMQDGEPYALVSTLLQLEGHQVRYSLNKICAKMICFCFLMHIKHVWKPQKPAVSIRSQRAVNISYRLFLDQCFQRTNIMIYSHTNSRPCWQWRADDVGALHSSPRMWILQQLQRRGHVVRPLRAPINNLLPVCSAALITASN